MCLECVGAMRVWSIRRRCLWIWLNDGDNLVEVVDVVAAAIHAVWMCEVVEIVCWCECSWHSFVFRALA